jgi:hypothetical protein
MENKGIDQTVSPLLSSLSGFGARILRLDPIGFGSLRLRGAKAGAISHHFSQGLNVVASSLVVCSLTSLPSFFRHGMFSAAVDFACAHLT